MPGKTEDAKKRLVTGLAKNLQGITTLSNLTVYIELYASLLKERVLQTSLLRILNLQWQKNSEN